MPDTPFLAWPVSDSSAAALRAAGADVHRGSLDDLDGLRAAAASSDGVIHTAFIHDFSRFAENCEKDRLAIAALADALVGSDRLLLVTSGTALLESGRVATEDNLPAEASPNPRIASELAADAATAAGVRVAIVRLPPSVHGEGDRAFVPLLIQRARQSGFSAYISDGSNRWPAVHRLDAAHLYRLAFEKGTGRVRYHAVAEEGVAFRSIAEGIARGLDVPAVSKSPDEAAEHFGWFAHFAAIDVPARSEQTRATLGWVPSQATLLDDLNRGGYFKPEATTSMIG